MGGNKYPRDDVGLDLIQLGPYQVGLGCSLYVLMELSFLDTGKVV